MITYFLALALVFDMDTKAPKAVAPFKTQEACHIEAESRTMSLPQSAKDKGAMYICLKVEVPGMV